MNARQSILRNVTSATLIGALLAVASFNAAAESSATLEQRAPVAATLLPGLTVTASISNPSAPQRWRIAGTRPLAVTLMPTLTITPDAIASTSLPRATVVARIEPSPQSAARELNLADASQSKPLLLGVTN